MSTPTSLVRDRAPGTDPGAPSGAAGAAPGTAEVIGAGAAPSVAAAGTSPSPGARQRPRPFGRRRSHGSPTAARGGAWARWLSPLALVALWQVLSMAGVLDPRTLASPVDIAATAYRLVTEGLFGSTLQHNTAVSLRRAALGFALGAGVALALAVPAGLSVIGDRVIDPPMQMLRMLPHLGLIPLFIIWMGLGEAPKIALVAFGAVFPLYLNIVAGIRGIDRKLLEVAESLQLSRAQQLRYVVLPGALPHAMTGLRQSLGVAWLTLIVAEQIASEGGLGKMIMDSREFLMNDVIVVGLVVYMLLGLTTDALVRLVERRTLSWRL